VCCCHPTAVTSGIHHLANSAAGTPNLQITLQKLASCSLMLTTRGVLLSSHNGTHCWRVICDRDDLRLDCTPVCMLWCCQSSVQETRYPSTADAAGAIQELFSGCCMHFHHAHHCCPQRRMPPTTPLHVLPMSPYKYGRTVEVSLIR
jgi:hypothetical protein